MTTVKDILTCSSVVKIIGTTDKVITNLSFDSREVENGTMFFALKGLKTDGHKYIDNAIEKGANTIVCEILPKNLNDNITYIQTKDSHLCLALIADTYYGHPSQQLKLIGITGTNGKTTLATLSYDLMTKAGFKAGLISTVNIKVGGTEFQTRFTTPDALTINRFLKMMVNQSVTHCFIEVSSHGIDQERTTGLYFSGGVFTNLTHDHLDYHNDFAEYRDVKKKFFDMLPQTSFALTNIDDKNGVFMLQNTHAKKKTYSLKTLADYNAKIIENSIDGLHLKINNDEVWTQLIGSFNAYNLLAIYAISRELGLEHTGILQHLSTLQNVAGRFQYFVSDRDATVIIDYAHTPDALNNVLSTIKDISRAGNHVITVVGCGGDRDKAKRPVMGHIASSISDTAIFTSDNPRSEDPQSIIEDMEKGVHSENSDKTLSILDRKAAIKTARKLSKKGDIILIAGKGHETYQEIKGVRYDFDDYQIAKEIFNQKQNAI